MDSNLNHFSANFPLPLKWKNIVQSEQLWDSSLILLNCLEIDLNQQLFFEKSLLILLSNERREQFKILQISTAGKMIGEWSFGLDAYFQQYDHAGIGHIRLLEFEQQIESWHHTLSLNLAVNQFKEQFQNRSKSAESTSLSILNEVNCPFVKRHFCQTKNNAWYAIQKMKFLPQLGLFLSCGVLRNHINRNSSLVFF